MHEDCNDTISLCRNGDVHDSDSPQPILTGSRDNWLEERGTFNCATMSNNYCEKEQACDSIHLQSCTPIAYIHIQS